MKFSVLFSQGAKQDLFKIYQYIKNDGRPDTAKRLSKQLSDACESLSLNLERGHVPQELTDLSNVFCRQIIVKNYRIIYQVLDTSVVIYGIIDGRRSISETLRQRLLT